MSYLIRSAVSVYYLPHNIVETIWRHERKVAEGKEMSRGLPGTEISRAEKERLKKKKCFAQ